MIRAIIFDCFDVLVGNGLPFYIQKYLKDKPELVTLVKKYENLSNAGEISYPEFVVKLSEIAKAKAADVERILDGNPINQDLLKYIATSLKPSYKIGMLSNASDDWIDDFFTVEQQKLFDDIVLSFRHGLIKPNIKIYSLAANRLGVKPEECVFVDDKETYCAGARQAGMEAIQYMSVTQLKVDISELISAAGKTQ